MEKIEEFSRAFYPKDVDFELYALEKFCDMYGGLYWYRIYKALSRGGIKSIKALYLADDATIRNIRGIGEVIFQR